MEPLAVEVADVSFSYGGHTVLRDINLTIEHKQFLALIGPNGSGKTTLLKLILGILKPEKGTIRIFGRPASEVVDRIGYVPQETTINKDFPISVKDVVLMGRLGHTSRVGRYSREDRETADKTLQWVGMSKFRDRPIGKLSGGQRQRVLIARALAAGPKVLLLDEPTASTDREFQTDLYELLKELNETATVVVVTHDLSILSSYVKSVACVNERLYYHNSAEVTSEMLDMAYHCPVELIAHGVPHRVLCVHDKDHKHD